MSVSKKPPKRHTIYYVCVVKPGEKMPDNPDCKVYDTLQAAMDSVADQTDCTVHITNQKPKAGAGLNQLAALYIPYAGWMNFETARQQLKVKFQKGRAAHGKK